MSCGPPPRKRAAQQPLLFIGDLYPDAIQSIHKVGYPAYKVHCDVSSGTFDYTFGNYTIKVSFVDSLYRDNIDGICTFGFSLGRQGEGRVPYILADSFMRGAYMVFDMNNDETGWARLAMPIPVHLSCLSKKAKTRCL
jgi:hypothetical protein